MSSLGELRCQSKEDNKSNCLNGPSCRFKVPAVKDQAIKRQNLTKNWKCTVCGTLNVKRLTTSAMVTDLSTKFSDSADPMEDMDGLHHHGCSPKSPLVAASTGTIDNRVWKPHVKYKP